MRAGAALVGMVALVLVGSPAGASGASPSTELVSVRNDGGTALGGSVSPTAVSVHGRYVAFTSSAKLTADDPDRGPDVYVRNRAAGITRLVSVSTAGVHGNAGSWSPLAAISPSGRYVVFDSTASNLVPGDTNGAEDVFVRDRVSKTTQRVSVSPGHDQIKPRPDSFGGSISADGRYVAFETRARNMVAGDTNKAVDVFVRDLVAQTTERVSVSGDGQQANGGSSESAISADGRYVVFDSAASNLVAEDTNTGIDVFVRDRVAGTTERVDVSSDGEQAISPGYVQFFSISADGRYAAFSSPASNLVGGDTNGATDVFVRDRVAGTTVRVSLSSAGVEGDSDSGQPAISATGRYVAFSSGATNLVPDDANSWPGVFRRDLLTGATQRVSVAWDGSAADNRTFGASISGDGRHIAFASAATNLVPDDANRYSDVFIRNLG